MILLRKVQSPQLISLESPTLFVNKRKGNLRLCIDYCALNNVTVNNKNPLQRINDLFKPPRDACVLSKIDARTRYYQLRIREKNIPKTASTSR